MKNYTLLGALLGVAIALILVLGGWKLFLTAVIFALIGAIAGAHFDGRINLVELYQTLVGKGQAS